MKLTEKQRKIVEMLGDELFNVQHIERYYKEDVPKSSSFDVFMFHNVRGHMKAVNQLIKITAPPKKSREDKFKFEDE